MADKRAKLTGRKGKTNGRFLLLPQVIHQSSAYRSLDGWSSKLLIDISIQYNGHNNGDLQSVFSQMRQLGWRSPGTLNQSLKRLQAVGLIQLTRQGGKHQCSLYAITWQPIDYCKGKLEVADTQTPSHLWKKFSP